MSQFSFDVRQAEFAAEVLDASHQQPVLVDFWAPWCGPCQNLKPMLEKLAGEYAGRFLLAKINSDENPKIAAQYGVRSIPAVKAFVGGELVDEFSGAIAEGEIRAFIDRLLPSPTDALREEAFALYQTGDAEGALKKLGEASRLAPDVEGIRLDAAEILLAIGRPEGATALLAAPYETEKTRAQSLRAQLALANATADPAELAERIAANENDLAARVELARTLAARGDYRPALDQLLEVVSRDRDFADGVGRKTMLTLFDAMWSDPALDDLIRDYRRRLAAALN